MASPIHRSPKALIGLVCVLLPAALLGCNCQPTGRPEALARLDAQGFDDSCSATPIFGPPIAAPVEAAAPAQVPPIEDYAWRPTMSAVSGINLGEVTVYSESFYDQQGGGGWGWGCGWGGGWGGDYFNRTFQSYRTGAIVK